MNKSQIPDILRPVTRTTMSNVDIFTSVLDPVNRTQNRVIFNLRQQGILNAGSRIIMSVHPDSTATPGDAFLPVGVGIAGCIDTAILRAGTRVLATSEQFGTYYFARRGVHTKSQKQNIDMALDGGCNNVGNSPNVDGKFAADVGSAIYSNSTTCTVPGKYKPVTSQDDCPLYSLALSDLFPMMDSLQLPLFAMEEVVSVELILKQQANPDTGKTMLFKNAPANSKTQYGLNNFQLHLDYLQYDDATMDSVRNMVYSNSGMPFIYDDLSVTTTSIPAVVQPAVGAVTNADVIREVGSAGLKVKNVVVCEKNAAANTLFGDYRSDSPVHPPEFNWRYNNRIVYPRKLFNTSFMRNEVEHVMKFPFSVPNAVYSHDVSNQFYQSNDGRQNELMDNAVEFEKQPCVAFAGTNFVTALNLEKGPQGEGTEILHKNILYERRQIFSRNDFSKRDIKFFTEYERSFLLRNGVLIVSA